MSTDEKFMEQAKIAAAEIEKITDPYQKVVAISSFWSMLDTHAAARAATTAAAITKQFVGNSATPTKKDLENRPNPATAESDVVDINPSAPIAKEISKTVKEKTVPVVRVVKEAPTTLEVEQVPVSEAPEELTEEFKNKILSSDELDATWTPRMHANADMEKTYQQCKKFFEEGTAKNAFPPTFLDKAIKCVSEGKITKWEGVDFLPPVTTKLYTSGIASIYKKLKQQQAARQQK